MLKMTFKIYDVISIRFNTNNFRVPTGVAQSQRLPVAFAAGGISTFTGP
jgi:hypothetical protein